MAGLCNHFQQTDAVIKKKMQLNLQLEFIENIGCYNFVDDRSTEVEMIGLCSCVQIP